jgi:hypothetical protein
LDKTLFVKETGGNVMIAQIFDDNILFGRMSDQMVQHLALEMESRFVMVLVGELSYFLGLQVKQMEGSTFISQSIYTKKLVEELGMNDATCKKTPETTHLKLAKEQEVSIEPSQYRSMIGSLLYLTTSRPDITLAVRNRARHQANPKLSHLIQVKRILRYINGTSDYGLLYVHDHNFKLIGYYGVGWNVKRTSRGCSLLGNNLISWFSENQNCLTLSSAEDEHIAADSACSKLVWMKQTLKEYNVEQDAPTLYCDYLSAINVSKNLIRDNGAIHTNIHPHFTDHVEENNVILEQVTSEEQVADIFTKALDAEQFEKLRGKLGICLHKEL